MKNAILVLCITTDLMVYQRPKPTLLAVNVPALDGGEGGRVRVLQRQNAGHDGSLAALPRAATRGPFPTTVGALVSNQMKVIFKSGKLLLMSFVIYCTVLFSCKMKN